MCFAINISKKLQYLGHTTLLQRWKKKKSARVISNCINSKTTSTKLQLLWFACDNCRVKSFKQLSTRLESCNGFHVVSHSTQTRTAKEMDGVLHKFQVAARTQRRSFWVEGMVDYSVHYKPLHFYFSIYIEGSNMFLGLQLVCI